MTCDEKIQGETLEAYVAGQLDEEAQAALERHVFECEVCAARLDDLMVVRSVLAEPRRDVPLGLGPRRLTAAWYGQPLAIAAGIATVMFSAAGAIWWTRSEVAKPAGQVAAVPAAEPPAPSPGSPPVDPPPAQASALQPAAAAPAPTDAWDGLSNFEAPALLALTLRGTGDTAGAEPMPLVEARKAYDEGNFGEAARLFEQWSSANGPNPGVAFYRGVSRLKAGEVEGGLSDLAEVIASGEVPHAVEAHLYVAYGRLALRDAAGARESLDRYLALDGDFTADARRLLQQLPRSAPPPR